MIETFVKATGQGSWVSFDKFEHDKEMCQVWWQNDYFADGAYDSTKIPTSIVTLYLEGYKEQAVEKYKAYYEEEQRKAREEKEQMHKALAYAKEVKAKEERRRQYEELKKEFGDA